jgi:hypothetical protein
MFPSKKWATPNVYMAKHILVKKVHGKKEGLNEK